MESSPKKNVHGKMESAGDGPFLETVRGPSRREAPEGKKRKKGKEIGTKRGNVGLQRWCRLQEVPSGLGNGDPKSSEEEKVGGKRRGAGESSHLLAGENSGGGGSDRTKAEAAA